MGFVDVAAYDALEEDNPHVVRVGSREIVLLRHKEEVFALRNVCPHMTQPFVGGQVRTGIEGGEAPGIFAIRDDRPILACPWHQWEYRLDDGRCPIDKKLRVRTFATRVADGRVEIDMQQDRVPAATA